MNAEFHVDAALREAIEKFAHFVLSLRNCHAVAGNDNHFVGRGKDAGSFLRRGAANAARFLGSSRRARLLLSESAEEHVRKRTVHGLRHVYGKNEPRSS